MSAGTGGTRLPHGFHLQLCMYPMKGMDPICFVRRSDRLCLDGNQMGKMILEAMASCTVWYKRATCFFFRSAERILAFCLKPKFLSNNQQSIKHSDLTSSVTIHMAENSASYILAAYELWWVEHHEMGVLLMKHNRPVMDLQVLLL